MNPSKDREPRWIFQVYDEILIYTSQIESHHAIIPGLGSCKIIVSVEIFAHKLLE